MKLNDETREQLAAQYVLGTLHGGARRSLEKQMMRDWNMRERVWEWEARLAPLLLLPPPQPVSAKCLAAIELRLFGTPVKNNRAWRSPLWGGFMAATALLVAVLIWPPTSARFDASYAALAINQQSVDWSFSSNQNFTEILARSINVTFADADKDYELWVLPKQGNPISLGVIRPGKDGARLTLSTAQSIALAGSHLLAVSLEPRDGSPTGQPTGPVLYTATFVQI